MSESNHIYIVYQTTNLVNQKIYIGFHKQEFHFPVLFDGYLGSGKTLGKAIKKYGKENFARETLHVFYTPEEAYQKEKEIVNEVFVNLNNTYNIIGGGYGASCMSEEAKRKIGIFNKGKVLSEKTKKKISNANKGKTYSEETKLKISESKKGTKCGKENPFFGRKHDEITSERIRQQNLGRIPWNKGRKCTEEEKKGYSERAKSIMTQERKNFFNDVLNGRKFVCVYCGMETTKGNIVRWHNDKCKLKP